MPACPQDVAFDAALPEAVDELDAAEERPLTVPASGHGQRLDRFLAEALTGFSRSHLQQLIERGCVQLAGQLATSASRKVVAGQGVTVRLEPTAQSRAFQPEPMALAIVHEDDDLLVIDKPAGLVVHPAAGNWSGTLMNGLLAHHAGATDLPRAGIVHRLDKDTSGLLVVAKTLLAHTALVRAMAAREIHRHYLALAQGSLAQAMCTVDAPIGRDPAMRTRMAVVASGKPARTDVHRLSAQGGFTAVRCVLHTGRTHQIRVHLSRIGHPLVSDALYGGAPALGLTRQALHAARLALVHPRTGRPTVFASPLPPDLSHAWAQGGFGPVPQLA